MNIIYSFLLLGLRLVPVFMLFLVDQIAALDIAIGAICFVSSGGLFYKDDISIGWLKLNSVWPITAIMSVVSILYMAFVLYW